MSSRTYSNAIDVWSSGCIFAEMLLRRPVFEVPGGHQDDWENLSVCRSMERSQCSEAVRFMNLGSFAQDGWKMVEIIGHMHQKRGLNPCSMVKTLMLAHLQRALTSSLKERRNVGKVFAIYNSIITVCVYITKGFVWKWVALNLMVPVCHVFVPIQLAMSWGYAPLTLMPRPGASDCHLWVGVQKVMLIEEIWGAQCFNCQFLALPLRLVELQHVTHLNLASKFHVQ